MDINELESFNMADAVKFHDDLNPDLWINNQLDPEVRDQLLIIANDFVTSLGLSDLQVKDVTVSGSNAAYSYTPHSDLDLHVLVDMSKLRDDAVYRELFTAKKTLYNDSHDITVHGVPVELYVQDVNEPVKSLGEYSVLHDKWIRIPKKQRANFDQAATKAKFDNLAEIVELALKTGDLERVEKAISTIKRYRKAGLDKAGEFGPENLAFKAIRKQGGIQDLYDLRDQLRSEKLSIEEADMDEDYDPNGPPPGPEFKPTMPAGTVRVDVSDVYDWYKLGQHISDLDQTDPNIFGKGPPSTIMAFGTEPEEHKYIKRLKKLGLTTTDIDPLDKNQPKGMPRQSVDPTYNVNESPRTFNPQVTPLEQLVQDYGYLTTFGMTHLEKQGKTPEAQQALYSLVQRLNKDGKTFANLDKQKMESNRDAILNHIHSMMQYAIPVLKKHLPADKWEAKRSQINKVLQAYNDARSVNLDEWADSPYSYKKLLQRNAQRLDYEFTTKEGNMYDVAVVMYKKDMAVVAFNMIKQDTGASLEKLTGTGDSIKVLSTVVNIVKDAVSILNPKYIMFEADTREPSRVKLYAAMGRMAAKALPNYTLKSTKQSKYGTLIKRPSGYSITTLVRTGTVNESTMYHVTPTSNLRSIMKQGLTPRIGDRSAKLDGEESGIFLFPSLEDVEAAVSSWLGDEFEDEDLSLLAIDTSGLPLSDSQAGYEKIAKTKIGPDRISISNELMLEASGYIPSAKEKNDPRFKTALTVDVKPDAIKKNAKAFGFKTSRAGIPPQARADGKIAESLMNKWKEFQDPLDEVIYNGVKKGERFHDELGRSVPKDAERLGALDNGQYVYHRITNPSGTGHDYYVVDPATKRVNIALSTYKPKKESAEQIVYLSANKKSLGAHKLYIYLVTKLDKILTGEDQSSGARAVWAAAAKDPQVSVHGYDPQTNTAVHHDPKDDENFVSSGQARRAGEDWDQAETDDEIEKHASDYSERERERRTIAVMHKKIDGMDESAVLRKLGEALGVKASSPESKIAESLMNDWQSFLGEDQQELFPGYDEQHREKRLSNWLAKSWGVINGKPQIFYHATTKDFDTFNTHGTGFASALGMAYEVERHGSFFAVDPMFAETFIEDPNTGRVKDGGRVLPVHLSIQYPIDLRDNALSRMLSDEETREEFKAHDIDLNSIYNHMYDLERWELFDGPEGAEFVENLQKLGFDGAIINESIPNDSNAKSGQVWVAFSPNQVKSIHNRGSFSPDDPRLMKETG